MNGSSSAKNPPNDERVTDKRHYHLLPHGFGGGNDVPQLMQKRLPPTFFGGS